MENMDASKLAETKGRICELIAESTNFDPSELSTKEDAHLHKELGIDSLTLLEIALSIDQEFETDFSEEELLGMESVNKAAEMVLTRLDSLREEVPAA